MVKVPTSISVEHDILVKIKELRKGELSHICEEAIKKYVNLDLKLPEIEQKLAENKQKIKEIKKENKILLLKKSRFIEDRGDEEEEDKDGDKKNSIRGYFLEETDREMTEEEMNEYLREDYANLYDYIEELNLRCKLN
jgi:hypothetical protein